MREIKFRAWDKTEARMLDWKYLVTQQGTYLNSKHFASMQFTGLHDKNGKEIYEGDILRMHCGSDDGAFNKAEIPGEVIWDELGFRVRLPDRKCIPSQGSEKGKEVSASEMHSWVGMHTCLLQWTSKLEVIGNIYENPTLLSNAQ